MLDNLQQLLVAILPHILNSQLPIQPTTKSDDSADLWEYLSIYESRLSVYESRLFVYESRLSVYESRLSVYESRLSVYESCLSSRWIDDSADFWEYPPED